MSDHINDRTIDPDAADVVDLGRADVRFPCDECQNKWAHPVRYRDDPESTMRCADCGKKHSKALLTA